MGRATSLDYIIGGSIRRYRRLADVSYRDLAAAIGVTEQQLDKYERAVDRVSAARLYRIAQALRVPIAAFFDGLPPALQDVPKPDLQASGAEPNSSGS